MKQGELDLEFSEEEEEESVIDDIQWWLKKTQVNLIESFLNIAKSSKISNKQMGELKSIIVSIGADKGIPHEEIMEIINDTSDKKVSGEDVMKKTKSMF